MCEFEFFQIHEKSCTSTGAIMRLMRTFALQCSAAKPEQALGAPGRINHGGLRLAPACHLIADRYGAPSLPACQLLADRSASPQALPSSDDDVIINRRFQRQHY